MSRKIVISVGGVVAIALTIITLNFSHKTPNSEIYTVIDVDDNLILNISNGREKNQIRLCGVDVPNSQKLAAKTLINKELKTIDSIAIFVFNGETAEVSIKSDSGIEKMLSEELLVNGLAKIKTDNCPNQSSLEIAETIAKQKTVGLWK
ncbi:MAG: thermonuclease family protein [Cuspidothrix sp.]